MDYWRLWILCWHPHGGSLNMVSFFALPLTIDTPGMDLMVSALPKNMKNMTYAVMSNAFDMSLYRSSEQSDGQSRVRGPRKHIAKSARYKMSQIMIHPPPSKARSHLIQFIF
jgi:hypothetical protein